MSNTSSYRFLRTAGRVTAFARVAVTARPSAQWDVVLGDLGSSARAYGDALRRGLEAVAAEQRRRGLAPHALEVVELVTTVVDTTDDAVECAAIGAAWQALGGDARDVTFEMRDGGWRAALPSAG
jgi:hypothetical protein